MKPSKHFISLSIILFLFSSLLLQPANQDEPLKNPKSVKPPTPVVPKQEEKSPTNSNPLQLLRLEITFMNGQYYRVVKKGESLPKLLCRIVTQGEGTLSGVWKINGQVVLPLQLTASGFQDISLPVGKLPVLPTYTSGSHLITLSLDNIQTTGPLPVLRYFVSTEAPLKGLFPHPGQPIEFGKETILKWANIKGNYQYQIAVSQIPFQFLSDTQIKWHEATSDSEWSLVTDSFSPDYVYWMIRALSSTGRIISTSEINFFLITEKAKEQEKEEVIK